MPLTPPNITGIDSVFQWFNAITGGAYGIAILVTTILIPTLSLYPFWREGALVTGALFGVVAGMFLTFIGILDTGFVALALVWAAITIILYRRSARAQQ